MHSAVQDNRFFLLESYRVIEAELEAYVSSPAKLTVAEFQ